MAKILIIDDDPGFGRLIGRIARMEGHEAIAAATLAEGLDLLRAESFDGLFFDVCLPDGNGLDRIAEIAALPGAPEIVIITGHGDPDGAELAITSGAWSYVEKSASLDQFALVLDQIVKYRTRREEQKPRALRFAGLIGDSPTMVPVLVAAAQAAATRANVLLYGETGTGKEVLARAIHASSARGSGPFVAVDCAAMPRELVESLLFGHVKGAFTGADAPSEGLVRQAHGGVLFLDEIGDLSLSIQKAFLRVLQERRFRPVGAKSEESSDFRLIAATNRNLESMCAAGAFRMDLLYRLKTLEIKIPPLRVRREDITALALHHVAKYCDSAEIPLKGVASEVLDILRLHDWPGNIRELVNTIERMCIAAGDARMLHQEHLPLELRVLAARRSIPSQVRAVSPSEPRLSLQAADGESDQALKMTADDSLPPVPVDTVEPAGSMEFPTFKEHRRQTLAEADKAYLTQLMEHSGGSIKKACEIADLSRTRLYYLMQEHGVSKRLP